MSGGDQQDERMETIFMDGGDQDDVDHIHEWKRGIANLPSLRGLRDATLLKVCTSNVPVALLVSDPGVSMAEDMRVEPSDPARMPWMSSASDLANKNQHSEKT